MGVYIGASELKNAYIGEYEYDYEPNANTLLYLPFLEDTQNKASSGITTTNNGATITTFGGIPCANFNGTSNYISTSSFSIGDNTTIIWIYNSRPTYITANQYLFKENSQFYYGLISGHTQSSDGVKISYGTATSSGWTSVRCSGWINQWMMYAGVKNGTNYTIYAFDGTTMNKNETTNYDKTGASGATYIGAFNASSSFFNGYMSRFIVESKAWSEQEILEYGNSTKSKYGL